MSNKLRAKSLLITGGAGFIGSEFTRQLVKRDIKPIMVNKITYAGDLRRLRRVKIKLKFYKADICDEKKMDNIFKKERPKIIVHFAAETHVDRSIKDAGSFIETNIKGTQILLNCSRKYNVIKFIQVSTDEVYGEIKKESFKEDLPLKPSNPYSASKAGSRFTYKGV